MPLDDRDHKNGKYMLPRRLECYCSAAALSHLMRKATLWWRRQHTLKCAQSKRTSARLLRRRKTFLNKSNIFMLMVISLSRTDIITI